MHLSIVTNYSARGKGQGNENDCLVFLLASAGFTLVQEILLVEPKIIIGNLL